MIIIEILLQDIIVYIENGINLATISEEQAIPHIVQAYEFLPGPLSVRIENSKAIVTSAGDSSENKKTTRLLERATKEANRGRYSQAIRLLEQYLIQAPADVAARRNLGMAYLEMGEREKAEKHIIETLNLNPQDAYSLLLIGNIYLQQENNPEIAERFFRKASEAAPDDAYILSNYGSLIAQREQYEGARILFRQAIAADPAHPHAHYGLALSYYREGDLVSAVEALENLFGQPESMDIRSEPVYQEAWNLYRQINGELAAETFDAAMSYIHQWRDRLEKEGGIEIELVVDESISTVAKTEIAWHQYGRSNHIVRYKEKSDVTPHILGHELQHIAMEQAVRDAGRNRFYTTNDETSDQALRSISADVNKIRRSGALGDMVDPYIDNIVTGLANQLFNSPLDMVIEHKLYHEHPVLRPSQFVSLHSTNQENLQAIIEPQIKKHAPRLIYNCNVSMNAAYAIFTDHLLGGSTNYAAAYEGTRYLRDGRKLFGLFLEIIDDYQPGDEYILVDEFAAALRLQRWYIWQKDEELTLEEGGGTTNPELLIDKETASVMYCLSALQRFENMNREEITGIVGEIAVLGQSGLDYATPDKKYTLQSLPGEEFSGLQLMCLMYVGFKDVNPALDVGMDLEAPYTTALKMHED